jgi:hypothetical protein
MDKTIPLIIFVVLAALIIGSKYAQLKDSLSGYLRTSKSVPPEAPSGNDSQTEA